MKRTEKNIQVKKFFSFDGENIKKKQNVKNKMDRFLSVDTMCESFSGNIF